MYCSVSYLLLLLHLMCLVLLLRLLLNDWVRVSECNLLMLLGLELLRLLHYHVLRLCWGLDNGRIQVF